MPFQQKLNEIARQIKNGVTPEKITVRDILGFLSVSRRGNNVNRRIRHALEQAGLETQPDFEGAYVDAPIRFIAVGSDEDKERISIIYRIDGLESANRKPVSVKPDSPITAATTVMLLRDYSQLPVMTGDREVKGTISWKSIGSRLVLGHNCSVVSECMEPANIIPAETSLFEAIQKIAEHDYVLVQASNKIICGIVTASDLSQQFRDLAEPFLLIGEIETLIRRMIHGRFKAEELQTTRDQCDESRNVTGVSDLTLGEYVRLLQEPSRWDKLNLHVDRKEFISRLDRVREVRNDVMHFDPQGVDPEAMRVLREFVRFLKELRHLGAI